MNVIYYLRNVFNFFRVVNKSNKDDKKKEVVSLSLAKHEQNPVVCPKPENYWESLQTFNPGAVLIDDKVHLLYRAIGPDGVSRLGYAVSDDGFCTGKNQC